MGMGFTSRLLVMVERPMSVAWRMDFPSLCRQKVLWKQFFFVCCHIIITCLIVEIQFEDKITEKERKGFVMCRCRCAIRQRPLLATGLFEFPFTLSLVSNQWCWRMLTFNLIVSRTIRKMPVGVSVRLFLDRVNYSRKTHPEFGWNLNVAHSMDLGPGLHRKSQWTEAHLSTVDAVWLAALSFALVDSVSMNWVKISPSSLKSLLVRHLIKVMRKKNN